MSYESYMVIKGSKQGQLKGECSRDSHKEKMPILNVQYEVHAPVDVSTGKAKGKRAHKPIIVTKEWGAATPQIFSACVSNELLNQVDLYFYDKDQNGKDQEYYHITLKDAHVIKHRKYTGDRNDPSTGSTAKNPGQYDTMELEDISLSFKTITVEHKLASTVVTDRWDADAPE